MIQIWVDFLRDVAPAWMTDAPVATSNLTFMQMGTGAMLNECMHVLEMREVHDCLENITKTNEKQVPSPSVLRINEHAIACFAADCKKLARCCCSPFCTNFPEITAWLDFLLAAAGCFPMPAVGNQWICPGSQVTRSSGFNFSATFCLVCNEWMKWEWSKWWFQLFQTQTVTVRSFAHELWFCCCDHCVTSWQNMAGHQSFLTVVVIILIRCTSFLLKTAWCMWIGTR